MKLGRRLNVLTKPWIWSYMGAFLVWIAAIAILVLIEKALPVGRTISRVAGAGFLIAGARLLAPLIPSTWLN